MLVALLAAETVSAGISLAVAGIVALAGLGGALVGGWAQARAAKRQADAERGTAAANRFTQWQVHKREAYRGIGRQLGLPLHLHGPQERRTHRGSHH